jgi:hypothetical protein
MDVEVTPQPTLKRAIASILRPLFRLLLRNGVSFGAFEALAKRVYLDVTMEEFNLPGRKPTISRASILSGLTRKEVQRLLALPLEDFTDAADPYHRGARVLTGWLRDPDFLDAKGEARLLDMDGERGFAGLVKRYSGDMPARAMLNELLHAGAVNVLTDGRLKLVTRGYVPKASPAEKIAILGSDVADLITTIDHNLEHGYDDPRFQRKVMYQRIPVEALPAFRKLSASHAQILLERLDAWLAEHDTDAPAAGEGASQPHARVGLGIYYFEDRAPDGRSSGDTP